MDAHRLLIAQAVDSVVRDGLMLKGALDVDGIGRAAGDLRLAIARGGDSGQRDIEYALHVYVFDLAQRLPRAPDGQSPALQQLLATLDIAALLSDQAAVDSSLAFALLEEAMDMVSIDAAAEIFAHVERRAPELRRGMTATGGKGIVMLKMCNSLLRRIPHATMGEFAGRVQVFVGNSFALSERSGVNLRGDFDRASLAQLAAVDDGDEDGAVYRAFWSLQEFFADPRMLQGGEQGGFERFARAATTAMEEFRKASGGKAATLAFAPSGREPRKHQTSPALLRLQFGDAQFKCQVLLQLLIFAKYVLSMSGERIRRLKETATNKFALNEIALSAAEQKQMHELRRRAGNQLAGAANDRGVFSRTAQFVVYHEAHWAKWKAESCRPFEQPPLSALADEAQAAARAFLRVQRVAFARAAAPMGSQRLADAWQTRVAPADLRGLGHAVRGADLLAAMRRLDLYCRDDGDYDLLTASEQTRADVLQWRALRSSVFDNMFRKIDPESRALASLRSEVLPDRMDTPSP
ncbi:hypothetical protein LPJ63_003388 [Coemansia sp. RSA 2711]|nr:hypothetical protein LPJ63_003388 [Coemansia sp. RSA 2711]